MTLHIWGANMFTSEAQGDRTSAARYVVVSGYPGGRTRAAPRRLSANSSARLHTGEAQCSDLLVLAEGDCRGPRYLSPPHCEVLLLLGIDDVDILVASEGTRSLVA